MIKRQNYADFDDINLDDLFDYVMDDKSFQREVRKLIVEIKQVGTRLAASQALKDYVENAMESYLEHMNNPENQEAI